MLYRMLSRNSARENACEAYWIAQAQVTSANFGRRRSASIARTRWPADAVAIARFANVVVLPSFGIELVTTMTL